MKKTFAYLAYVCLTFTVACTKETTQQTPPDTTLEITVNDELGNKVSGATVALLDNEDLTQIGVSQTTDINGVVTFKNLKARNYAWAVVKGVKTMQTDQELASLL